VTARACNSLIRPSSSDPSVDGSRVHNCSAFFNFAPAVTGDRPNAQATSSWIHLSSLVSPADTSASTCCCRPSSHARCCSITSSASTRSCCDNARKSVDPNATRPTTVGRTETRSLHTYSPRSSTSPLAKRRPTRSDPIDTPLYGGRSGGGSWSGSFSSGGNSHRGEVHILIHDRYVTRTDVRTKAVSLYFIGEFPTIIRDLITVSIGDVGAALTMPTAWHGCPIALI
jgi:hypothetical protein